MVYWKDSRTLDLMENRLRGRAGVGPPVLRGRGRHAELELGGSGSLLTLSLSSLTRMAGPRFWSPQLP